MFVKTRQGRPTWKGKAVDEETLDICCPKILTTCTQILSKKTQVNKRCLNIMEKQTIAYFINMQP